MDPNWNDNQPIYRQLRDRMVALILESALKEGDPLPSVRTVAADYRLNPLTVLKGYQQLVDEGLVEKRRGRGMYVSDGARASLADRICQLSHAGPDPVFFMSLINKEIVCWHSPCFVLSRKVLP